MSFRHLDVEYLAKCEKCHQTDCRRDHLMTRLRDAAYAGTVDRALLDDTKDAVDRCRKLEKSMSEHRVAFLATKAR